MKNNAWKKQYIVTFYNDYDKTWQVKTIPCTFLQAVRFVTSKNWLNAMDSGQVKIEKIEG